MKITRRLGDSSCACTANGASDVFETTDDQLAIVGKVVTPEIRQTLEERGVVLEDDHEVVVLSPQAIEQLHRAGYSTSDLPFVEV